MIDLAKMKKVAYPASANGTTTAHVVVGERPKKTPQSMVNSRASRGDGEV